MNRGISAMIVDLMEAYESREGEDCLEYLNCLGRGRDFANFILSKGYKLGNTWAEVESELAEAAAGITAYYDVIDQFATFNNGDDEVYEEIKWKVFPEYVSKCATEKECDHIINSLLDDYFGM